MIHSLFTSRPQTWSKFVEKSALFLPPDVAQNKTLWQDSPNCPKVTRPKRPGRHPSCPPSSQRGLTSGHWMCRCLWWPSRSWAANFCVSRFQWQAKLQLKRNYLIHFGTFRKNITQPNSKKAEYPSLFHQFRNFSH